MDIKFMWEYGKVLGIQLENFSSRNVVISTLITLCTQTHTHTIVPTLLPCLQALTESLLWYGSQASCHVASKVSSVQNINS